MTTREKRLATAVGAVAAVGIALKVVYPLAVKPMFDVEDEIARLQDGLFDVQEERDRVDDVLHEYKQLVDRTGSTDPVKVKNNVQARLEEMLRAAGLESRDSAVTPKKPVHDRKTGVDTVSVTVSAEGKLQPVIEFLEKCYELPYVSRFKDVKLAPTTKTRQDKETDRVKLGATLQVLTLPEDPRARGLINLEALEQPDQVVKHAGDAYAMIWERKPFNEFVRHTRVVKAPEKPDVDKKPVPDKQERSTPRVRRSTGDRDRRDKYVAGVLRSGTPELMVVHKKRKTREYVAPGDAILCRLGIAPAE